MGKFVKILESLKNNPGGLTFSKFDINEMTESNQEGEKEESFHEDPSKSKQQNQESENDIGSYTKLIYSIVKDFFSGVIEINSMCYLPYPPHIRGFMSENQIFTSALWKHSLYIKLQDVALKIKMLNFKRCHNLEFSSLFN